VTAQLCPQCRIRPLAPRYASGRRTKWMLATCNAPACVNKARRHAVIKIQGVHEFTPAQLRKRGAHICPACGGQRIFLTIDGVAWEACSRCERNERLTPMARPKGWSERKAKVNQGGSSHPAREDHP
jgi:hypothetical protein